MSRKFKLKKNQYSEKDVSFDHELAECSCFILKDFQPEYMVEFYNRRFTMNEMIKEELVTQQQEGY